MPNSSGCIATMPPPTPLFAGRPTCTSQSPDASYMPQLVMTAVVQRATSSRMTRSPLTGLRPPFASVAPMIARSRAFTATEHWRK